MTANRDQPTVDSQLDERLKLLEVFKQLVIPLGCSLPSSSEVVLHDLSKLPNSIIAIYGDVTNRSVGDPATDKLLRSLVSENVETIVNYETRLKDGRQLQSSTMIIRDFSDEPFAALCINSDVSVWHAVQEIAASMLPPGSKLSAVPAHTSLPTVGTTPKTDDHAAESSENFVQDVDELANILIAQAIDDAGVPTHLMRKSHKMTVVRTLKANGMFLLKDAVEMIAEAIEVSRFTIYNYLNEIESSEASDS